MSNMGARVSRMFRNFNLENRVIREISKEKPHVAPRHKTPVLPPVSSSDAAGDSEVIHGKNEPLVSLLKTVWVQSEDPLPAEPVPGPPALPVERRPLKFSLPGPGHGLADITDVPKGRLSLVEALRALNSHKTQPATWTAERVALEYCLAPADTAALLQFFIPFNVKILPPQRDGQKQIKGS
ncbi:NADH dehydrogenase [ubiquinone] 1 alpha subcomplex assembly factor 4 [Gadus macrocephalus]|uniref:NADH dehydrogenase [ubiquinone] 1 alpha subcomplex assembly factor 4 n=1 Tax=Gadus macrocephalus TaxID=80720 RepID=UPI0028CB73BA|nr:NADH dehydrogenase [ubiquinone] 1 alpha subcomplex assembly factor 4 [Gadus macrocephalus]